MIRCLAKTPQLLGPSVTFDLGKASKKSDNYHFWGGVFSAFLGAKKHFFQKVLKKWSSIKKIENIFINF